MSGWLVVYDEYEAHVKPVQDDQQHYEYEWCPCEPKVEHYGNYTLFIHNSFDGREFEEEVKAEADEIVHDLNIKGADMFMGDDPKDDMRDLIILFVAVVAVGGLLCALAIHLQRIGV